MFLGEYSSLESLNDSSNVGDNYDYINEIKWSEYNPH
jgi:hypothetical protein